MKYWKTIGLCISVMMLVSACGPSQLIVTTRPAPPVVVRPVAPGPDYIWIEGGWVARGGQYVWRRGRWVRPHRHHDWVSGHWERHENGWYWERGHWH